MQESGTVQSANNQHAHYGRVRPPPETESVEIAIVKLKVNLNGKFMD